MKLKSLAMFCVGAVATGSDKVKSFNLTDNAMSAVKKSVAAAKAIDVKKIKADAASYVNTSKTNYKTDMTKAAEYVSKSKAEFAEKVDAKKAAKAEKSVFDGMSNAQLKQVLAFASETLVSEVPCDLSREEMITLLIRYAACTVEAELEAEESDITLEGRLDD